MLKVDPEERAILEEILEDPWIIDSTVVNKVKQIVFADSNAIDNQADSLLSSNNEKESVDESLPKRQWVSS
jgi:hypothetical protein